MELRQLEYLVAVAEEANFTRAAERVHISQSGVSAQIRALEHDLGAALIDRSGRRATLTAAGRAALAPARAALAAVQEVRQAVDDVAGLIRGRLVMGMVTACTMAPLFDALASFHAAHPGVDLALVEDNSDRLIERVRDGRADVALVARAGAAPADLAALPIISEGLVAGVAAGHPLARRRRVGLAEVCEYPIVSLPEGTGVRTVFELECRQKSLVARIGLEASAPDAVVDLARRGLGVAVLTATMAQGYQDRIRSVPISDVTVPAVLALVWTSTPSPAVRALVENCRQAFATTQ